MTKDNSESFEDYCKNSPLLSHKANGVYRAIAENAWKHQAKKLQAAEEKIEELYEQISDFQDSDIILREQNKTLLEAVQSLDGCNQTCKYCQKVVEQALEKVKRGGE